MNRDRVVFVAGHLGMVGSAIVRRLRSIGYTNIVTVSRGELNLLDHRSYDVRSHVRAGLRWKAIPGTLDIAKSLHRVFLDSQLLFERVSIADRRLNIPRYVHIDDKQIQDLIV